MTSSRESTAYLTVSCKDRPGIVSAVSGFLFSKNANIIHSDQHSSDPVGGRFFLRMKFHMNGIEDGLEEFRQEFAEKVADKFDMEWNINPAWIKKKQLSSSPSSTMRSWTCSGGLNATNSIPK